MIDRREILDAASTFRLLPNVVEKDYVLGWLLAGINADDENRTHPRERRSPHAIRCLGWVYPAEFLNRHNLG